MPNAPKATATVLLALLSIGGQAHTVDLSTTSRVAGVQLGPGLPPVRIGSGRNAGSPGSIEFCIGYGSPVDCAGAAGFTSAFTEFGGVIELSSVIDEDDIAPALFGDFQRRDQLTVHLNTTEALNFELISSFVATGTVADPSAYAFEAFTRTTLNGLAIGSDVSSGFVEGLAAGASWEGHSAEARTGFVLAPGEYSLVFDNSFIARTLFDIREVASVDLASIDLEASAQFHFTPLGVVPLPGALMLFASALVCFGAFQLTRPPRVLSRLSEAASPH